uniref:Uncharacterized protein n=1 Tax=Heterorhabditis bacteriophora TaxID=37862 RepID=A0A1I7XNW0_HETBA
MTFDASILQNVFLTIIADRIDTIPAWYQLSSRQMTPPFTYERREPQFERMERPALQYTKAFASYPSYGNPRQPFTEGFPHSTPALTRPVPLRRYPGGQDMPYESSVSRYHKLLLRKQIWKSTQYTTTVPSISTEKKPMSLRKIYSIITPKFSQHTPLPRILPAERLNNATSSKNVITEKWKNIIAPQMGNMSITSTSTITIIPTKNATSTSVFSKIFPLPRVICKQILEKHEEEEKVRTLAPFRTLVSTWKSKLLRITTTTQKTAVNKPASMLDYIWVGLHKVA